jgi:ribosomal protein L16 Arg81 hydroxylase
VASRKINNDQKAQVLKKPQLQAQLSQLEEQLSQYKKIDQEYQQKMTSERELLQSSHREELEKLTATLKAEAAAELQKSLKQRYLVLSQFLRTAAAKRQQEGPETDERQAFEGVLLLVYGGDAAAVDAIEKVVEGSTELVNSVEGTATGVTCKLFFLSLLPDIDG